MHWSLLTRKDIAAIFLAVALVGFVLEAFALPRPSREAY
jgi:hypothetical protein